MLSRILFVPVFPPTNIDHQWPWQTPNTWSPNGGDLGHVRAFQPPAGANIYRPIPRSTSWPVIVTGAWKAISCYHLSATAAMELEVLDTWKDDSYGSQHLIGCIDDTENHNFHPLAFRFDASGKGAYGRWWVMVDVLGKWIRIGGQGRCR